MSIFTFWTGGPLLTAKATTDEGRVEEANGRAFQAHGPKWRVHDEGAASATAHPLLHEAGAFFLICREQAFAYVGALYATTECVVEKVLPFYTAAVVWCHELLSLMLLMVHINTQYRGKNDLMNPLIAGCISGGLLASRGTDYNPFLI